MPAHRKGPSSQVQKTHQNPISQEGRKKSGPKKASGSASAARAPRKTGYQEPKWNSNVTLYFDGDYRQFSEASLPNDGRVIKGIRFGTSFNIQDEHLRIIADREVLCQALESFKFGDSDSGNGGQVSDAALERLAKTCPNLRVLSAEAATRISDKTFASIAEACPLLEKLDVTGNDKVSGRLTAASIKLLTKRDDLLPNLKELRLLDQRDVTYDDRALKSLSKSRKKLVIKTGETQGSSMAASFLDDGAPCSTYVGGKVKYEF